MMNWLRYTGFFPFLVFMLLVLPYIVMLLCVLVPFYGVIAVLNLWGKVKL